MEERLAWGLGGGSAERRAEIRKGREGRVKGPLPLVAGGQEKVGLAQREGVSQDPSCVGETGPISGPSCPAPLPRRQPPAGLANCFGWNFSARGVCGARFHVKNVQFPTSLRQMQRRQTGCTASSGRWGAGGGGGGRGDGCARHPCPAWSHAWALLWGHRLSSRWARWSGERWAAEALLPGEGPCILEPWGWEGPRSTLPTHFTG